MRIPSMTESAAEGESRFQAHMAGAFYLLTIVAALIALLIRDRLFVAGDAAATAANILAHQPLFRFGFASDVLATVSYLVVTALFYGVFKSVNRSLSLLSVLFGLVGCAIGTANCILYVAPLLIFKGAQYLHISQLQQVQVLALVFLEWNAQASRIGFAFFGIYCVLIGLLVFRSLSLQRRLAAGAR